MPRYPILTYAKAQGGIAGLPIVRAQSGMGFTAALGPGGGISLSLIHI